MAFLNDFNMVYLSDVDPTIIENVRYATSENFTGSSIIGYHKPKAIATYEAALALSQIQKVLLKDGFSLVVYDAYRPQKAVDSFAEWAKDFKKQSAKKKYYPRIDKENLFKLNYISDKSGHSRGSTFDVSIISLSKKLKKTSQIEIFERQLKDGFKILYLDDNTVDMGSSFDLFDIASHHNSPVIDLNYLKNRNFLRDKMLEGGFRAWQEEWWHYTLEDEPYPETYFDFEIK